MSNQRRKRRNKHNPSRPAAPVIQQEIYTSAGRPIKNMLFKPVSYQSRGNLGFDHLMVPFRVDKEKVFALAFMDSCELTVYIECFTLDKNGILSGYDDMSAHMKECLEMQEALGVPYYFGKLDKTFNQYLYALQIFINKGFLDKEKAIELIKDIGFDPERIQECVAAVEAEIEKGKEQRRRMGLKNEPVNAAGDTLVEFLMSILGD